MQTPHTTESTRHHEREVAPPVDIHETREERVGWGVSARGVMAQDPLALGEERMRRAVHGPV